MSVFKISTARSLDLHFEFKGAFKELNYKMWPTTVGGTVCTETTVFCSFFEAFRITYPSESRKGLVVLKPGADVQMSQSSKLTQLLHSALLDILTVLHFFMVQCDEADDPKAYDVDKEIDLAAGAALPKYHATRKALIKLREAILDHGHGMKGVPAPKTLAQSITLEKFPSNSSGWINWELSTIAKFQSAGIVNILTDDFFAQLNPRLDSIAAGLLKAAFANESSYLDTAFLMEDGDLIGSGNKIWKKLRSFYEYPNLIRHTLREYQTKFENLEHKLSGDFEEFARKFMQYRNIIIHLQEKAADLDDVTIITPTSWKGHFINKISGDVNATATATHLKLDNTKDLWMSICEVNAHLAGLKEHNANGKAGGKKKNKDDEEKPGPKDSKKDQPASKQGPTLIQQLYNLKNATQDEEKKKNIQALIDEARSKESKKRPFQEKQGQGKGGGKGPKRRRRGGKTDVAFEEDEEDDDDRSMTGAEANSIFG